MDGTCCDSFVFDSFGTAVIDACFDTNVVIHLTHQRW